MHQPQKAAAQKNKAGGYGSGAYLHVNAYKIPGMTSLFQFQPDYISTGYAYASHCGRATRATYEQNETDRRERHRI